MKISTTRFMFRVLLTLIAIPIIFVEFGIRWIIAKEEGYEYFITMYARWVDKAIFE